MARFGGGKQKDLDKNWHTVDNHSRASSCLPQKLTYSDVPPLRIAGIVCEETRWRKKKPLQQAWKWTVK
jgi:hypothetical protein